MSPTPGRMRKQKIDLSGNNNGNGNGNGKPVVGGLGPIANPNYWSQNGSTVSSSSFLGTLNNYPLLVKINNTQRASFTNTGLTVYGNTCTYTATVDSILTAWQIIVNDVLQATIIITDTINSSQYLLNGVPLDFPSMQNEISNLLAENIIRDSSITNIQNQVSNIQQSQWAYTGNNSISYSGNASVTGNLESNNLLSDTVVLSGGILFSDGSVQTTAADFSGNSSDTTLITTTLNIENDAMVGNNLNVGNTVSIGSGTLYLQGYNDNNPQNHIYTSNADLYIQDGSKGLHYNTIINANNSNGKVGIGTNTPLAKLHLKGGDLLMEHDYYLKSKRNGNNVSLIGINGIADILIGEASTYPSAVRIFTPTDPGQGVSIENAVSTLAFFKNDGNVGIGTSDPKAALHILRNDGALALEGTNHVYMKFYPTGFSNGSKAWLGFGTGSGVYATALRLANEYDGGKIYFSTKSGSTVSNAVIDEHGNLGLGTTDPEAKLHIRVNTGEVAFAVYNGNGMQFKIMDDGKFYARGYKIMLGNFPDYVFGKNYQRMRPVEKAKYIEEYGHLPYLPSAKEVEKEGLDVGDGLIGITRNVEENSLDINDLHKQNIELLKRIEKLENEIKTIKNKKDY